MTSTRESTSTPRQRPYPDPVLLKQRVHEALEGHTKDVQLRRSCVTVFYQREGEPIYHVDLAVYSEASQNADGQSRIAKAKPTRLPSIAFGRFRIPKPLPTPSLNALKGLIAHSFAG